MTEGEFCEKHPGEKITQICTEEECKLQKMCSKCISSHFKHAVLDINQFWSEKLQKLDLTNLEQIIKGNSKDPFEQEKGQILVNVRI